MSSLPKKDDGKVDWKNMWEFKLLKGIMNFFIYGILLIYLLLGGKSLYNWSSFNYYIGDYTTDNLAEKLEILPVYKQQELLQKIVTFRQATDIDDVLSAVGHLTSEYDSRFYFLLSNKYYFAEGRMDDAIFYNALARFRLRYDALRCNYPNIDRTANKFAELMTYPELTEILEQKSKEDKEVLRAVIEWDRKNQTNSDPEYFCEITADFNRVEDVAVIPEDKWINIRNGLYLTTYNYIEDGDVEKIREQMRDIVDYYENIEENPPTTTTP